MFDPSHLSLVLVACAAFAIILISTEVGWQFARRRPGHEKARPSPFENPMLGLLALMLAFTFSMALSRHQERRTAVLNEANSIGTTALRARLLPEPERSETLKLLREYVRIRLDLAEHGALLPERTGVLNRSDALQEALWQQAKNMVAKDKSQIPTGLFITSLNEMIDDQEKRLSALRNNIPDIVLLTLVFIAAVTAAFSGYGSATDSGRSRVPVYVMGLLVSAVMYLIIDLDRAGSGFIQNSQKPMLDLAASMAGFVD